MLYYVLIQASRSSYRTAAFMLTKGQTLTHVGYQGDFGVAICSNTLSIHV